MKFYKILLLCVFLPGTIQLQGQEILNLAEKPGTFEILARTDYTASECGFTKTEIAANLERIKEVVAVMRQNPVLSNIKGFSGRARIYTMSMTCKRPDWYGVPSRISLEFSSFFMSKGKVVFNTIEPPEWSIYLNDMNPSWAGFFNNKHGYITVPLKKETVDYGIDVYDGECFVIYDPSRPPYWVPVTVDEAFATVWEDLKNNKDPVSAKYMKEYIDKEYAAIPVADRNKPAYMGGMIARVSSSHGYGGQDSLFPAIMKINPEYWNKKLPKSAVQFMFFRSIQNKQYLKRLLDECNNHKEDGSGCDLRRFELSFGMTDIRNLVPQIGK